MELWLRSWRHHRFEWESCLPDRENLTLWQFRYRADYRIRSTWLSIEEQRLILQLYTRSEKKKSWPDGLCVNRQGGDEENHQDTEERSCERERTVLLELRSPNPWKPHETKCHE